MPWNFPLWQVYRFAAPALMAGNVGVLKHASNVPGCALAIEEIFADAGFPEGAFRTLLLESRHVRAVIEDPLVRAVTLTGSTPAGKAVAAQAGAVLKKTVLELGGSDPYIVLEDADLDTICRVDGNQEDGRSARRRDRHRATGTSRSAQRAPWSPATGESWACSASGSSSISRQCM